MKFSLVSDLHLEFSQYLPENEKGADVLILSGDIMIANALKRYPNPREPEILDTLPKNNTSEDEYLSYRFREFLKHVTSEFKTVIGVAGNHEFYGGDWSEVPKVLKEVYSEYGAIFLHDEVFHLSDEIAVFGSTLWTDLNNGDPLTMHCIRDMMNDYRVIRDDTRGYTKLKPSTTGVAHKKTLQLLRHFLSEHRNKKFVVVSHHAPSSMSIAQEYQNDTLMNGGYHSKLEEFILDNENIAVWTHGHMHNSFEYEIGNTLVLCNPRGYAWRGGCENSLFSETSFDL